MPRMRQVRKRSRKNQTCGAGTLKATLARPVRSAAAMPTTRKANIEGDYGAAGSEGRLPEPLGDKARESGRFVKADYGDAGLTPGRTAESEIGRYSEGHYGADGTVDPLRNPGTDPGKQG